jgi:Sensors of blue-light using FAD
MPAVQAQPECQPLIEQMAYCSLATPSVHSLAILPHISTASPELTGLLMWEDRLLIHWLEGSADQIHSLWAQVQNDPQQHCLVRLLHRPAQTKRLFADWQMCAASRQDMMVIVREAKEHASKTMREENSAEQLQWQHAVSTLSILLDPEFTRLYAQTALLAKPLLEVAA